VPGCADHHPQPQTSSCAHLRPRAPLALQAVLEARTDLRLLRVHRALASSIADAFEMLTLSRATAGCKCGAAGVDSPYVAPWRTVPLVPNGNIQTRRCLLMPPSSGSLRPAMAMQLRSTQDDWDTHHLFTAASDGGYSQ
jgi:hypothetical protein